jgi:hypothetical protein
VGDELKKIWNDIKKKKWSIVSRCIAKVYIKSLIKCKDTVALEIVTKYEFIIESLITFNVISLISLFNIARYSEFFKIQGTFIQIFKVVRLLFKVDAVLGLPNIALSRTGWRFEKGSPILELDLLLGIFMIPMVQRANVHI